MATTVKLRVPGLEDDAHADFAQPRFDDVGTNRLGGIDPWGVSYRRRLARQGDVQ